jgi:hypothetical protein
VRGEVMDEKTVRKIKLLTRNLGRIFASEKDAALEKQFLKYKDDIYFEALERLNQEEPTNTPDYAAIGKEIGELVAKKNLAYGDSFTRTGAVLRAYFPDGIKPDQYDLMSYIVRTSDKFFRLIANNDPAGENPAMDIAGYSILEVGRRKEK